VRRIAPLIAACAAAIGAGVVGSQARATGPPDVRVAALRSLDGPLALSRSPDHRRRVASASARFRLAAGSRQGHGRWFLVRLKACVILATPRRADGYAQLSIALNRKTAVSVQFRGVRRGRSGEVLWDTLDLLQGERDHRTRGGPVDVLSTNYAQLSAVRGGLNTATVRVDEYGPRLIRAVRVEPETGVLATHRGPSTLTMSAARSRLAQKGKLTVVAVRVHDTGDDARAVRVSADANPSLVHIERISPVSLPVIRSGRTRTVRVAVRAVGDEASTLVVSAYGSGGQSSARTTIVPARRSANAAGNAAAVALLLTPAGIAALIACRRRRARSC